MTYRLGKRPATVDRRDLKFASYLVRAQLPQPPPARDWAKRVSKWGMMRNDVLGDCTCAAAGHMVQAWTANNGKQVTPTDAQIVAAYNRVNGGTDAGANPRDALSLWRKSGIGGHKIEGYVSVGTGNTAHVRSAIDLFGGLYLGLQLPDDLFGANGPNVTRWDVCGAPNPSNGHMVCVEAYGTDLAVVTWGVVVPMTWRFLRAYCDEAYAVLSPADWLSGGKCPSGFDVSALRADLGAL